MGLRYLLDSVNESTVIRLYSAETNDLMAEYDGVDEVPDDYDWWSVTDIFVDGNALGIEVEED